MPKEGKDHLFGELEMGTEATPPKLDKNPEANSQETIDLVNLTSLTGLMSGISNKLNGFENALAAEMNQLDPDYEGLYKEYLRLKEAKLNEQAKAVRDELRLRRNGFMDAANRILNDRFAEVFEFTIDNLSDEFLRDKMKFSLGQKEIISWLYKLLGNYEEKLMIGTGISRTMEIRFIEYAKAKGQRTVANLARLERTMPTSNVSTPIESRGRTIPAPPMVVGRQIDNKPRFTDTLRPTFPVEKSEQSNRPITQPYMAGNILSGKPDTNQAAEQALKNAAELVASAENLAKYNRVPPDLRDIFDQGNEKAVAETEEVRNVTGDALIAATENTSETKSDIAETPKNADLPLLHDNLNKLPSANDVAGETIVEKSPEVVEPETALEEKQATKAAKAESKKEPEIPWYTRVWNKAKSVMKNHGRPLLMAMGLAAGMSGDTVLKKALPQNNPSVVDNSSPIASNSAKPSKSVVASNKVNNIETPEKAPNTKPIEQAQPKQVEQKLQRTFSKRLLESKSPIVQDIINSGVTKMGHLTVTDTMITSFVGLASDAEKAQLIELQNQVNLAIGVYFNENFGTEAKLAKSLKDPRLKNLYRTARVAKEKGWYNSTHTKENFPQAAALAERLFADSTELGLDQSSNTNEQVKAFALGNMFQAKLPGDSLNFKKADGTYHIIQEMTFQVFEGKLVKDLVRENAFGKSGKASPVAPSVDSKSGKTGNFLQNIFMPKGWDMFRIGGMKIATSQDKELMEIDKGWDQFDNNSGKPTTEFKEKSEMDLIDEGWEEIGRKLEKELEQNKLERSAFEKNGLISFNLPLQYTTKEENQTIIPMVAEKLARLYPEANQEKIKSLVRQYGFIAFKKVHREGRGVFRVEIHPNFQKIFKMALMEKTSFLTS